MKRKSFSALLGIAGIACLSILTSKSVLASDYTIPVSSATEMKTALDDASTGDEICFVLQQDIYLGENEEKLNIPENITVTVTNEDGKDIAIVRHPFTTNNDSRIDVNGSLIIQESEVGGTLTLDGGGISYGEDPVLAVYGTGSSLTVNGGTITGNDSYYGAIYSCDGASTTITGGTFSNNGNTDVMGLMQGGCIYAANSNLSILGGNFIGNVAGLSGGAIYYDGRSEENKLSVSGGLFDGNIANGAFGGAAIYIDCQSEQKSFAEFTGGTFQNNETSGLGGAVYIQVGAEATMQNLIIYSNVADSEGGGIWNCPTGAADGYNFHGIYLADNTAGTAGDDFFSMEKQVEDVSVYLTDYAFTGDYFGWIKDEAEERSSGVHPEGAYYQLTSSLCALKSSLSAVNAPTEGLIFRNNTALSGGAIANNGMLRMGEASNVNVQKVTTKETADVFTFQIQLKNGDQMVGGNFVCKSSDGTLESITFDSEGKATIQLNSGETKNLVDLPIGVTYEISEQSIDGWKLKESVNCNGTIELNNETAVFTNEPYSGSTDDKPGDGGNDDPGDDKPGTGGETNQPGTNGGTDQPEQGTKADTPQSVSGTSQSSGEKVKTPILASESKTATPSTGDSTTFEWFVFLLVLSFGTMIVIVFRAINIYNQNNKGLRYDKGR